MKIAVTGKGGVGKTTVAAALSYAFAEKGYTVVAIDADPDANLASALGIPAEMHPAPISSLADLIEERTGAKPGTSGGLFRLNPRVDDLPEKLWVEHNGVRLMVMGSIKKGGGGCVCPESVLLKSLVQHLMLYRNEVVVMDMEAGVEHLGRATAQAVNHFIVVLEPGMRSIETARQITKLAHDIGITSVYGIANKIRRQSDRDFFREVAADIPILAYIPHDETIIEADLSRRSIWQEGSPVVIEARRLADSLAADG